MQSTEPNHNVHVDVPCNKSFTKEHCQGLRGSYMSISSSRDMPTMDILAFRVACFTRAVDRGQPVLGVPLTREELEDVLDTLRYEVQFPIRPRPLPTPVIHPLLLSECDTPDLSSRFMWRWYIIHVEWMEVGFDTFNFDFGDVCIYRYVWHVFFYMNISPHIIHHIYICMYISHII